MAGFRCGVCNRPHDHLPRDLAYRHPADYFAVPKDERGRRIHENDDLCVIDDRLFLIRGVLYLPIQRDDDQFGWGVWARVDKSDFERYVQAWKQKTEDQVEPFVGWLSGGVGSYAGSDGLEVTVVLVPGGQRPRFMVRSDTHPLGIDQRQGISTEKAHSFVARFM